MSADIHPTAIIEPGARIADTARIGPYCVIGPDVIIEAGSVLHSAVTLTGRTYLGPDCEVFSGAVIGAPPQIIGFEALPNSRVEIGARTIIREHVTVHAGSKLQDGLTFIGADCLMMVGVHIAHDCYIGDKCVFANQVTLAGNVHIEEQVWLGGVVAIAQHTRIGRHAFSAGGAIITASIIPYGYVSGNRAKLVGLNLVGLKRRGYSREAIRTLRNAYRILFAHEGSFSERIADTRAAFSGSEEVGHILEFIEAYDKQSLVQTA